MIGKRSFGSVFLYICTRTGYATFEQKEQTARPPHPRTRRLGWAYVLYVVATSFMLLLRPLCRSYLSSTSFMMGLRPVCRSYLSSTSFIYRLRPLCRDCVLYVGATCRLRPLSIDYVLYDGITSCMLLLRPLCRDCVLYVGATCRLRPACRHYPSPTSHTCSLGFACSVLQALCTCPSSHNYVDTNIHQTYDNKPCAFQRLGELHPT